MEDERSYRNNPSGDANSSPEDVPGLTLEEIREILPEIADGHMILNVTFT